MTTLPKLLRIPRWLQVAVCGCLLFAALANATIALISGLHQARFQGASVVTMATVTHVDYPSRAGAKPTFEFVDQSGGVQVAATSTASSDLWRYPVGSQVEVRYDPQNPSVARPTGFLTSWIMPLAFGSMAAFNLALALALSFVAWKWGDRLAGRNSQA